MKKRELIVACAGIATGAGCTTLENDDGRDINKETLVRDGPGEYHHEIRAVNNSKESIELTVTVELEDEQIHEGTFTISSGAEEIVMGITEESLPDGEDNIVVRASTADGKETTLGHNVSECLGNFLIGYTEDRKLNSTYSIC
jgi:hypothetical protein